MSSSRLIDKFRSYLKTRGGTLILANTFKEFDSDNSGAISWDEFCAAFQKSGIAPAAQDLRALFLSADKDGNNEISYDEFVSAIRVILVLPTTCF